MRQPECREKNGGTGVDGIGNQTVKRDVPRLWLAAMNMGKHMVTGTTEV